MQRKRTSRNILKNSLYDLFPKINIIFLNKTLYICESLFTRKKI